MWERKPNLDEHQFPGLYFLKSWNSILVTESSLSDEMFGHLMRDLEGLVDVAESPLSDFWLCKMPEQEEKQTKSKPKKTKNSLKILYNSLYFHTTWSFLNVSLISSNKTL